MNSTYSANWKYQESQSTQICLTGSGAEALCFCLTIRQRKSQILTWYMLTQALKSVNLSSDLWFMQCNPVITVGRHRWSSLLWPLEVSKLIKEWNDKAGSWSLDPKDQQEYWLHLDPVWQWRTVWHWKIPLDRCAYGFVLAPTELGTIVYFYSKKDIEVCCEGLGF